MCRFFFLYLDFLVVLILCVCNIIKYDYIIKKYLWKVNECFFVCMGFKIFVMFFLVEKLWFIVFVVFNK